MQNDKCGNEITSLNPGWIKKEKVFSEYLLDILLFYVVNTPCEWVSSSAIALQDYGWKKTVWKDGELKKDLFHIARLEKKNTFVPIKKLTDMKQCLKASNLSKNFHKDRDVERVAFYKGNCSEFMALFSHIRNSLAHGRFTIYTKGEEKIFVMEDGIKRGDNFYVRSRMVLKETTLLKWKEHLQKISK